MRQECSCRILCGLRTLVKKDRQHLCRDDQLTAMRPSGIRDSLLHGDWDGGGVVAKRQGTFRFHARLARTSSVVLLGKTNTIKTSRGLLVPTSAYQWIDWLVSLLSPSSLIPRL